MVREYLFTSESVSEGHPDKIADQISDAVLDCYMRQDPYARVACETLVTRGMVFVAGEITSKGFVPIQHVARDVIKEIGYTEQTPGFNCSSCNVSTSISLQAADIDAGVSRSLEARGKKTDDLYETGAGDQGLMFGYAITETPQLMPLAIMLAHELVKKQAELRKKGVLKWLGPDAKSQVTVRYADFSPVAVESVVLSTQHGPEITSSKIRDAVISEIIQKVIPPRLRSKKIEYLVNPTGRFVTGGPDADTGLTGRKIIVDTYGGSCPHGGGAFSGKDPTKVDRSAAYMARYIAKNIVAAGLAQRCTVQLSYAIAITRPISLMVNLHGTGRVSEEKLEQAVPYFFNLTPDGIIRSLDLRRPIYRETAAYGHFGRELPTFTWEKTDIAPLLQDCFNIRGDRTNHNGGIDTKDHVINYLNA